MRQEELAAAAGISRQSIIAIEKGRFNPSLEAAIRIARCFGVPVEAVFFPEAEKQTAKTKAHIRPVLKTTLCCCSGNWRKTD